MNLKIPEDVDSAARPSRITLGTHEMLASRDVKGEATDDSASERETPTCAAFSAPQSFAPSPHMAATRSETYFKGRSWFSTKCLFPKLCIGLI